METRRLGTSDLELSILGLGTWAIGGDWKYGWGPQKERDSINAIHEGLELGINWIDTAAVYGFGTSEAVVGKALSQWKGDVAIATKCGRLKGENGEVRGCLQKESIVAEVEGSLKRLRRDVVDLYQIHWPLPDEEIEEGIETLQALKSQGKIRWVGVSNFSVEQLDRGMQAGGFVSLQPPFSLLRRNIEDGILPWCRKNGVGIIAYSPLQCGLLTGKVDKDWVKNLPDTDFRKSTSSFYKDPLLSRALEYVDALKGIARDADLSLIELALAWVVQQEGITSAIVGTRRKGQIAQSIKAVEKKLSPETLEAISELGRFEN
jgi:aryl-alcohol dehydrogenase-like predicted oxidoreductase